MEGNKSKVSLQRRNKEKIQESERGIFLMSIACKINMQERRNFKMEINKQIYQVCKLQERKADQLWII